MTKSLIRVSILITLSIVAFIGIFSTPIDDSPTWFSDLLISKSIGFLAAWVISKLYPRWAETDKWVSTYDKWCAEVTEED